MKFTTINEFENYKEVTTYTSAINKPSKRVTVYFKDGKKVTGHERFIAESIIDGANPRNIKTTEEQTI